MKTFDRNTIVNIVRAEISTDNYPFRVLCFETVTSAEPEPVISKGDESELRVRNTILAQDTLEDIIKGYDITLKDCVLSADLLEVIDGGTKVTPAIARLSGYQSPVSGTAAQRPHFTLRLYAEEKDFGGQTISVFRFSFPNCVGTPAKFQLENGTFTTPEYLVRSRPLSGDCAMIVECLDKLPVFCTSEDDIPQSPEKGDYITVPFSIVGDNMSLNAGDTAYFNGLNWVAFER